MVCKWPFQLGKKTWDLAVAKKRLDEQLYKNEATIRTGAKGELKENDRKCSTT